MRLILLTLFVLLFIPSISAYPTHKHRSHRVRHEESKSRSRRLVPQDPQSSRDHQLLLSKPYWPWP